MFQHSIENGQKLPHTGRQRDFFDLSRGEQPLVKSFDPRVVTRGPEGAHGQDDAHVRAATPNGAPTPQGPTVAMEGCYTHQGRARLPRERPQCGEFQPQRPRTHGPNTWGTLPQIVVFPPPRAGPQQCLKVVVQRGQSLIEPGNMGLNVLYEVRVVSPRAGAVPQSAGRAVAGGARGGRAVPASGRRAAGGVSDG